LFGLGGWGPGPPSFVERRESAESGPLRQAKSPGRPKNDRRALAGWTGAASGKSARLIPNSPPPVTAPSSRGSWPRANRIKSGTLAAGGHASPVQVEGSRGKNATGQGPVARQSDIGQRNLGHRNKRKALGSSFLCPPFLCHSSLTERLRPSTAGMEARVQTGALPAVG
jgi:hypothetical protein